jgi:hypothetical protein
MASITGDTTGALLAHDKVDRYRPLGAFGKPAYQSYVQLRATLLAKLGPKYANYFAKPNYDVGSGELRWTAEVPGTARGWHEMAPEEQAQRALDLEVMRSDLANYAQELRARGGNGPGGAQAVASLLEQALKVPAQGNFLYFVGDQPVVAFWGFETHTGGSVDAAAVVPQYATQATPTLSPVAPVQAATAAAATTTAAVAVADRRKRPWWWWLLWALLALLLLLALLFALRACTDEPIAIDQRSGGEGVPSPDARDRVPPLTGEQPGVAGTETQPGDRPGSMALPDDASRAGIEPRGEVKPDPGVGERGMPPDGASPDAPLPDVPKPKPDIPTDPLAKKDAPQPLELPPADPKPGRNMDFLEGRWRAGEGLADRGTGQPLDLSFDFDKDGKGEVTLRRGDGTVCKGPVTGNMSGAKLSIEGSQSIPCSGGGAYAAPKIECTKDRGGQTQCFGVNPDGSRYYMGIQRGS